MSRPGFRLQTYFPMAANKAALDSPLGPKQTSMVPVEWQAYKSETTGRSNLIRMTKAPAL